MNHISADLCLVGRLFSHPRTLTIEFDAMEKAKTIFGRRLRLIRKERGMTIEGLGKTASLGYKHVADIERGVKVPSFDAIDRLARALEVEAHQLFVSADTRTTDFESALRKTFQNIEQRSEARVKQCLLELMEVILALEQGSK